MTSASADHPWLHRLALVVAGMCLFMIVAGGMVTSMEAGDAVPDWPLSYGSLLPPMVGNIFWEHGHRLVGMTLGLLTILLTVALGRTDPRRWVRRLGYIALPAVCAQGALGGLRVKIVSSEALQNMLFTNPTGADVQLLRTVVAIVHTASAQAIFCLLVVIALVTSRRWLQAEPIATGAPARRLRAMSYVTVAAVFVQLLLGALRRHTDGTIVFHAVGAVVVAVLITLLVRMVFLEFTSVRVLLRSAVTLLLLLGAQLVLGLASWLLTASAIEQSLHLPQILGSAELASALLSGHVAVGAAMLAVCVTTTLKCHRFIIAPAASVAAGSTSSDWEVATA